MIQKVMIFIICDVYFYSKDYVSDIFEVFLMWGGVCGQKIVFFVQLSFENLRKMKNFSYDVCFINFFIESK